MSSLGRGMALAGTIGVWLSAAAQDIHFSQFFHTPLATAPGAIGQFDGEHRVSAVYRQQWRSVTRPFSTFGLSGDMANAFGNSGLGLGAWLYNDRTGDSRLNTFHFSAGGSYGRPFGPGKRHELSLGVQFGLTTIAIKSAELQFDAQYNGFYFDPSLPNGELFQQASLVHPDLHAGIRYGYRISQRENVEVGLSFFNLTRPPIGFLGSPPQPLDIRSTFFVSTSFPVAEKLDLLPMVQYMAQGQFQELILGTSLRYVLLQRYDLFRALRVGGYWRAADAGYVYAGLEYDQWTAGISYDVNVSDLVPASRNRGGVEFTLIRMFSKRRGLPVRFKACPEQL
ncbi:MAG: PorP/SprF family type IX secretion system membrane protein [Flavobacteriales bacterium]|nr:PorP/SprF family type IX secretion system membrane protein [Flavobacteriales bacterium]